MGSRPSTLGCSRSVSSSRARLSVTSHAGTTTLSFSVARATIEAYVRHATVRARERQSIWLLGPKRARVDVQVLYPDGHFWVHHHVLDARGRGEYNLTVTPIRPHTRGSTVVVEALVTSGAGTSVAVTSFSIRWRRK